jgi:membrane-associated protease RseP (regulator of RpoE activity)
MTSGWGDFYVSAVMLEQINLSSVDFIIAYDDAPAVRVGMQGAIVQMNDVKILGQEDVRRFMQSTEPGDEVRVITENEGGTREYDVVLGEHPSKEGIGYLGVGYGERNPQGIIQNSLVFFMSFKEQSIYYKPTWDGEFVYFFYHLFWWVMIINLLVALFNMLPIGMLDGGRFFYLFVLGVSHSEKVAKWVSKLLAYAILAVFVLLMYFWFIRIF